MKALKKLRCNEIIFNIYAALFFTLILNGLFIARAWKLIPYQGLHDYLYAATLPVVLFCAFLLIFNVVALPWIRKPLLLILIIASAAANYFMYSFGTVIATNMIQNVFETDLQDATALFSIKYVLWMLVLGLLPAALMVLTRIESNRPGWMS
ncbi:MAG TPA: phosphoethanolamine transferase EptA, partial [Erwinia persicina]|nr:phosphoethanolamine transferase EptA [Erwinia persicina]